MKTLPFLISIPHGGTTMPQELQNCIDISAKDLFDDSDSFTRDIYNVSGRVKRVVTTEIARAFIDVSRSPDMLPPEFTDGVIKSATCYNKPIYKKDCAPDAVTTATLLKKYYFPFHHQLQSALSDSNIALGIDCHSMAETAPKVAPDKGKKRPRINLGNLDGTSCDPEITACLKQCFMEVFGFDEHEVLINQPFKGGYITRKYGSNPVPMIQVEMNRSLYLNKKWFDPRTFAVDKSRIAYLNRRFIEVLERFYTKSGL